MEPIPESEKWSALQKAAFRFIAVYLFIYIFPFPADVLYGDTWFSFCQPLDPVVKWVGRHWMNLPYDVENINNGSGDTGYEYAEALLSLSIALTTCIIWTVVDRKRKNHIELLYLLKVYIRAYLSFYLVLYGLSKVPGGQFPQPDFYRLLETYGESSPMGLAWTFFGFSTSFGLFMGFFEALSGLLIFFRRTTLLGACMATAVTSVIVMVNMCFDVPAKLFSTHLLLMAVFLVISDSRRLVRFFLLNKPVEPADNTSVFDKESWRLAGHIFKVFIAAVLSLLLLPILFYKRHRYNAATRWKFALNATRVVMILSLRIFSVTLLVQEAHLATIKKSKLYGVYTVRDFVCNLDTLPPLTTDSIRWEKLAIEDDAYATLYLMNGRKITVSLRTDHKLKTIEMRSTKVGSLRFSYSMQDSILVFRIAHNMLTHRGIVPVDSLYISMQCDYSKLLLVNRGFHWINEQPFNR